MSLFFLHHSPKSCIPCTAPRHAERKHEKRPLLLNSGSGCEFLAVLHCDFVSLCAGKYVDTALDLYVCVSVGTFISLCLPFCDNLYVCMRVEFLCSCLRVYPSVFSFVCSRLVSVCLMCWILSMLLSVSVFMQPMIVCIYASQSCMGIPVSMLSYVSYQYWRVCKDLITLLISPWCDMFLQFTGRWLTVSVSSMLLGAEWPKKEPWSFRLTERVPC